MTDQTGTYDRALLIHLLVGGCVRTNIKGSTTSVFISSLPVIPFLHPVFFVFCPIHMSSHCPVKAVQPAPVFAAMLRCWTGNLLSEPQNVGKPPTLGEEQHKQGGKRQRLQIEGERPKDKFP